jgi:transglutaminase-like putative cysteine protease
MLLTIRHETVYHYTAALTYTIQQLRLTPRAEVQQRTLAWNIRSSGTRHPFTDAFGNLSHTLTITRPHHEVRIIAEGTVAVAPLHLGRLPQPGEFSPLVFTVPTQLTQPTVAVMDFAHRHLQAGAGNTQLLDLAQAICAAVAYQSGSTAVTSSAAMRWPWDKESARITPTCFWLAATRLAFRRATYPAISIPATPVMRKAMPGWTYG